MIERMPYSDLFNKALLNVSACAFLSEETAVKLLLQNVPPTSRTVFSQAEKWITGVREKSIGSGIEPFQREYNLSSTEGILLMCLAEALLRIPDARSADELIRDKVAPGQWESHTGKDRPWLINWAGYGLGLAGKIASPEMIENTAGEFLAPLIRRLGEPVVRTALREAMKIMGNVFVVADTIQNAIEAAQEWHEQGYLMSYDMLGEGARTTTQAEKYFESYRRAILALPDNSGKPLMAGDGISIKLSALHPRFELRQFRALKKELLPRLHALLEKAAARNIPLTIDAEEANRLDVTLLVFERLLALAPQGYQGLGLAVQAYQKRAYYALDYLLTLSQKYRCRIPVRLVKGAYWDSEIKRAQVDGLPDYPVFTRKYHTDVSYLACARKLLHHSQHFYPQFATHNALTIASILELAGEKEFEFQRLHGMGEALYAEVLKETKKTCRIYAPVGSSKELLSYLIRRILENGANSSFINGLNDKSISLPQLLHDPLQQSVEFDGKRAQEIPLPRNLLSRVNTPGLDLGYADNLLLWSREAAPFNNQQSAGHESSTTEIARAFETAAHKNYAWADLSVESRAAVLDKIAETYLHNTERLIRLMTREAGKTVADAYADLREAMDFCYYYAEEARRLVLPRRLAGPTGESNQLSLHPRGVIVAISPWNFPLAIFTGQIVAALVTGNAVIAKPAEQTPEVAAYAIKLIHEAGVPKEALHLVFGQGETVGQALVQHPFTAGVVFTGSTGAAFAINRALAARATPIVPLIAETGGQNCMVVDSSALIEQTVDDMIASAFTSAGQRCSALRVAFVQEDIADELEGILAGAMQQLRVGDPASLETDIGPVIDMEAAERIYVHIERMRKEQRFIAASPNEQSDFRYIAPHAFGIVSIEVLKEEIFGPVLHIVRYKAKDIDKVVEQINSTGYGLTFGIQSRIDERIRYLSARVKAGNIYVNRNMIGAVVGVQPFGGEGLSGTGPKAGGPHYLTRFCVERTITINTAAVGGNLDLLAHPRKF